MGSMIYDPKKDEGKDRPSKTFDMPPAGAEVICVVRREMTEWRESKRNPGNRYLNVRLEVISGPGLGYYLYYTIPEGEYMMSFLGRFLAAIGYDTEDKIEVDVKDFIGRRCRAVVKHKDGKADINYFKSYDPSIEDVHDHFAEPKVAPKLTVNGGSKAKAKAKGKASPAVAATEGDSDLPF